MKFGDNLKKIRKMRKISQEELADKIGVSRQSISKWETGENHPSMTNIMCLCTIFKCNINELVHEDMTDINSLDEDIKMSVVKFKNKKQKRVKILSNIIVDIAKIGKIISIVLVCLISIATLLLPFVFNNIDIKNNRILIDNETIDVVEENNKLLLKHKDEVYATVSEKQTIMLIKGVITGNINNKVLLIVYCEIALISLILFLILNLLMYKKLEKLFNNIKNGNTPFTLENVEYIKSIAYIMIALIVLPNIGIIIFETFLKSNLNITFEPFSLLEILIIYVISYVFEYGYEIQLDSKGIMYEDKKSTGI